jgi:drug/metabolite transporter (DMT)-like permease
MTMTWILVLSLVTADSAGNIFLTRGMKQVGQVHTFGIGHLLRIARRAIVNPWMGLGIVCMAVSFFLFLALLSGEDLSFVLPATALAYVMSVLGAKYILKETVSASRWIGTLIICAGVALITLDGIHPLKHMGLEKTGSKGPVHNGSSCRIGREINASAGKQ